MVRPHVALVGWRLGGEFDAAIRKSHDRFRYTVISMDLGPELRPLVDWRRMPRPQMNSFRAGWATFYTLAGLRLARLGADLVHAVGPVPVVPNRVDVNTVTFCQAAYVDATAGRPLKGSSSAVGWKLGQRFMLAVERRWFSRAVRVLVGISEGGAAELRRFYPGVRVVAHPRGVDLGRFRPDDEDRARLRAEHGIAPDAVVAIFVDQQHRPHKGLEVAVEALARARRAGGGPDLLWVMGDGNEQRAALAREFDVADRVRFLGYRSDIERWYRAADLFVLPTAYETFCRAAHEAAASGLPVVAPAVNGIRELVGADEAGIITQRDPADVARALAALAADPSTRMRMGRVARTRALAFDNQSVADHILALHESLL